MSLLGRSTIHPVLFILAKAAFVPPHVLLSRAAWLAWRGELTFPRVAPVGAGLVGVGLAVAWVAGRQLGASLRVGLPDERTEFCRHGLDRRSRNPIYAGLFLAMFGSCLLVPSALNLASTAVAIGLHHQIVLAEECFLDARFGQAWRDYRARVRRYA